MQSMRLNRDIVTPKNETAFEKFFENSKCGNLFQSSRWGQLKADSGWESLRYVFKDERTNDIQATALILKKKVPLSNFSILYVPRGPILEFEKIGLFEQVLKELHSIAIDHKAIMFKVNPNVGLPAPAIEKVLIETAGRLTRNPSMHSITLRLGLKHSDDELMALFETRARTALKKALKEGVQLEEAISPEKLKLFFEILAQTSQRKDFYIPSLSLIEKVHSLFIKDGFGKIYLAKHENDYLAGACFLRTNHECRYMWGGSLPIKRNMNPNHLIQWSALRWARDSGCASFDFQGVDRSKDDPKTPSGSYLYKSSFGGEEVKFVGEYDVIIKPLLYDLFLFAEPKYRKIMSWLHRG